MIQVNLDKERLPGLAAGCINAIKIERLQKQVTEKKNLLREVADLEKQIRALRSDN